MSYKTFLLKDLVKIKYGKNQKNVETKISSIPIYGTGGLMGYANEFLYDKPSVLIGRKGTIGKVKYVEHPFWTVDTLFYTIVDETKVFPKYLFYALSLIDLNIYNEGTTIPSLRTETLNRIEVKIPSLSIQEKILSILNPLDLKIALNNQINKNLMNIVISKFKNDIWCLGKNGSIGDYCSIKSGYPFKSSWWTNEGVKVIRIGDIYQDELNLNSCACVDNNNLSKCSDFRVNFGDVVIAMTGATIGKFSLVSTFSDVYVNQRVGKFYLGENPIKKLPFIYCTLKMKEVFEDIVNKGQGSAQPNISSNDLENINCVIPNIKIIDDFNNYASPIFYKIIINQIENNTLSKTRDLLLPKLLSGELDVSNVSLDV